MRVSPRTLARAVLAFATGLLAAAMSVSTPASALPAPVTPLRDLVRKIALAAAPPGPAIRSTDSHGRRDHADKISDDDDKDLPRTPDNPRFPVRAHIPPQQQDTATGLFPQFDLPGIGLHE